MEAVSVDLAELEQRIGEGGATLVHHFATWCDPCEEELPILGRLFEESPSSVRRIAVAWDLFMTPVRPEEAVRVCSEFLARLGVSFDLLLVYTGTPEELFDRQGIDSKTVPYTDLRDANGHVVATFPEPVFEAEEQQRLAVAMRDL